MNTKEARASASSEWDFDSLGLEKYSEQKITKILTDVEAIARSLAVRGATIDSDAQMYRVRSEPAGRFTNSNNGSSAISCLH